MCTVHGRETEWTALFHIYFILRIFTKVSVFFALLLRPRYNKVKHCNKLSRGRHTLSSLASIVPDPSVSKRSKASLISCFCSSVNSGLGPGKDESRVNKEDCDNILRNINKMKLCKSTSCLQVTFNASLFGQSKCDFPSCWHAVITHINLII